MQKLALLTSSILTVTLTLTACGGGDSSSPSNTPAQPTQPPTLPIPKPPVDTKPYVIEKNTVSGLITDDNNVPLANATVVLGRNTVITNKKGTYTFNLNEALKNDITTSTIIVKKQGYFTTVKEIPFTPDQAYKLNINLAADQISEVFETRYRFTHQFDSQAGVHISFNSVANSDGQVYNGTANVATSYYGPDSSVGSNTFVPPFSGQRRNGSTVTDLANVGMFEVKLTDSMGNNLVLAENNSLTLTFPETSTDQSLKTIPLWHYDEKKAIWVEEGVAERQDFSDYGSYYEADVSSLGLWSLSIPLDQHSALIKGCTVESDSNTPTSQFDLLIGGKGFETYSRVDKDGRFSIAVPISTPLLLSPVQNQVTFRDIQIPALARNEVYNIDNGKCIATSKGNTQDPIDLNAQKNAFLNQLAALPAIVKPTVTSATFQSPLTISARKNVNVIGYQFDLVNNSAVKDILLKELDTYLDPNNSKFNTGGYKLQSLYAENDKYVEYYKDWSKTIITPNGLLASSAQGARYLGPYLENTQGTEVNIAAVIEYDTTFSNNQLVRNYYDKLLVTNSYRDQPLTSQKIADILFYGAPKTPANVNIINTLNRLPLSISTFDSSADCKILTARKTNVDYIDYVTKLSDPQNSYADIKPALVRPITGSWFQDNPIKWSAERATNAAGISRAVVSYDGLSYKNGVYVKANTLTVSPIEKQQCNIYNEAAKNQILEALSKVTLPSQ